MFTFEDTYRRHRPYAVPGAQRDGGGSVAHDHNPVAVGARVPYLVGFA